MKPHDLRVNRTPFVDEVIEGIAGARPGGGLHFASGYVLACCDLHWTLFDPKGVGDNDFSHRCTLPEFIEKLKEAL